MGEYVVGPRWVRRRLPLPAVRHDSGFTLLEMLTTMVIAGIVMATTGLGWMAYSKAQAEKGTANGVVASLRDAAQRAEAEGRVYCISFDPGASNASHSVSWSIWRYSCDSSWTGTSMGGQTIHASKVGVGTAQGGGFVDLAASSLSTPTLAGTNLDTTCPGGAHNCAYFYPRGISSYGTLTIGRADSSKVYLVKLEGLTSRAYLS